MWVVLALRVAVCCQCCANRRATLMKRGPTYLAKGPQEGEGRGLRFRTSPSWCSSSAALVSRMWVNTRASFARCHLTEIVVGTTTEGGMWPDFVFVFVFLRVPY